MSGPYPPPGYPRPPDRGGWGDQPHYPYGDFPTVQAVSGDGIAAALKEGRWSREESALAAELERA